MRTTHSNRRGRPGQGLVEFALVGPAFLLLVIAVTEGSLAMSAQATLDNATREGARAAALCGATLGTYSYRGATASSNGSPCPLVATKVVRQNLGVLTQTTNPDNPFVSTTANGACTQTYCAQQGAVITVSVTYNYSFFLGVAFNGTPGLKLTSEAKSVSEQ